MAQDAAAEKLDGAPSARQLQEAARLLDEHGEHVVYWAAHPAARGVPVMGYLRSGARRMDLHSCQVIHERRGGTVWSRVPETHLLRTASLLAEDGYFMLHGADIGDTFGTMSFSESYARRAGVLAARQVMLSPAYDLTMTYTVEAGKVAGQPLSYYVFRGPRAEPVTIG